MFGGGPVVMRVGGSSSDRQTGPPSQAVLGALSKFVRATGSQLILGLNYEKGDPALAAAQKRAAEAALPQGSIMSFELGNEVCVGGGMFGMRF